MKESDLKMNYPFWNSRFRKWISSFFVFLILSGCASMRNYSEPLPSIDPFIHVLKNGFDAFVNSDYTDAEKIFDHLLINYTDSVSVRQQALFGLACARLSLADTPESIEHASHLLDMWSQHASNFDENPRMLIPFIKNIPSVLRAQYLEFQKKIELGQIPTVPVPVTQADKVQQTPPNPESVESAELPVESKHPDQMEITKRLLRQRIRENKQLKTTVENLEKEIISLKKQIESLEDIHQKIREKKNSLTE